MVSKRPATCRDVSTTRDTIVAGRVKPCPAAARSAPGGRVKSHGTDHILYLLLGETGEMAVTEKRDDICSLHNKARPDDGGSKHL